MWRGRKSRIGKTFLILLMLQTYICDWDKYGTYSCELISEPETETKEDLPLVFDSFVEIDHSIMDNIRKIEDDEAEW